MRKNEKCLPLKYYPCTCIICLFIYAVLSICNSVTHLKLKRTKIICAFDADQKGSLVTVF